MQREVKLISPTKCGRRGCPHRATHVSIETGNSLRQTQPLCNDHAAAYCAEHGLPFEQADHKKR